MANQTLPLFQGIVWQYLSMDVFWHRCPKHFRMPKFATPNRDYWEKKISRNAKRDRSVTKQLKEDGWTVIRFWEHDLKGGSAATRKKNRMKKIVQQLD